MLLITKKGLPPPITGAPEKSLGARLDVGPMPRFGQDDVGIRPAMLVQGGDLVSPGQVLFPDVTAMDSNLLTSDPAMVTGDCPRILGQRSALFDGSIHHALPDSHVADHPAPGGRDCYACGPPMMNAAVIKMSADCGVERENTWLDGFGG